MQLPLTVSRLELHASYSTLSSGWQHGQKKKKRFWDGIWQWYNAHKEKDLMKPGADRGEKKIHSFNTSFQDCFVILAPRLLPGDLLIGSLFSPPVSSVSTNKHLLRGSPSPLPPPTLWPPIVVCTAKPNKDVKSCRRQRFRSARQIWAGDKNGLQSTGLLPV